MSYYYNNYGYYYLLRVRREILLTHFVNDNSSQMLLDSSEFSQPLLRSRSPETVFAVDDDNYESTGVMLKNTDDQTRSPHTVRFHDTVQVIAPSLRSTLSSREIGVYVFGYYGLYVVS